MCEQLAQGCYLAVHWGKSRTSTSQSPVQHATIVPPSHTVMGNQLIRQLINWLINYFNQLIPTVIVVVVVFFWH